MTKQEIKRYRYRIWKRGRRHGNWRQTFVDYGGICALCYSPFYLEFHEPFGEDNGRLGWLRFQARILLCYDCHTEEHDRLGMWRKQRASRLSMLSDDVEREVEEAGGWSKWIEKFHLVDRFGCLIK